MKTNQIMVRDFDGNFVSQRTDNAFLNATDLLRVYNDTAKTQKRFLEFWENKNTNEFIEALLQEENVKGDNSYPLKNSLVKISKGKYGSTYMHPYLFVKFAMWLSPEFEVKVVKWITDQLIQFRNNAGDHYTEMCDVIKNRYVEWSKGKLPEPLVFIREANFLKELAFGAKDKSRNDATEEELKTLSALEVANIKLIKQGLGKDDRYLRLKQYAELL